MLLRFRALLVAEIGLIAVMGLSCLPPRPAEVQRATEVPTSAGVVVPSVAPATPSATATYPPVATATWTPFATKPSVEASVTPSPAPTATSTNSPTLTAALWTSGWPQAQATDQITALAVDRSDQRTVYASTSTALYRSTDGGANWTLVRDLPNVVALHVIPGTRDALYAYFWPTMADVPQELRGFGRSSDGGRSWSDPSGGASADLIGPATTLAVDPSNPDTVLVGTAYHKGYGRVLRSTDGGVTWQVTYTIDSVMGAGGMTSMAVHPEKGDVVYAAHTVYHGGSVVRSDDGGVSWRFLATIPMPLFFPASLALDPSNPDAAYVVVQGPMGSGVSVFRTSDGGVSWVKRSNGLPEGAASAGHVIVDPIEPKVLFLSIRGDHGGIYRSTNSGDSWTRLSSERDPQLAYSTALAYSPLGHTLYVGTNAGVWQRSVRP